MILIDGENNNVEIEGNYNEVMAEILTLIDLLVNAKAFDEKDIKILIDILKSDYLS